LLVDRVVLPVVVQAEASPHSLTDLLMRNGFSVDGLDVNTKLSPVPIAAEDVIILAPRPDIDMGLPPARGLKVMVRKGEVHPGLPTGRQIELPGFSKVCHFFAIRSQVGKMIRADQRLRPDAACCPCQDFDGWRRASVFPSYSNASGVWPEFAQRTFGVNESALYILKRLLGQAQSSTGVGEGDDQAQYGENADGNLWEGPPSLLHRSISRSLLLAIFGILAVGGGAAFWLINAGADGWPRGQRRMYLGGGLLLLCLIGSLAIGYLP
jgi:hypothetical protein